MTKKQIAKRYDAIIRQCFKDMEGGLTFGMDWNTLKIVFPERYEEICKLRQLWRVAK
jgi:hypothetical protein